MVDFTKNIVNSDKFRGPALTFIRTGSYCNWPKNTTEYMRFWQEEQQKCINGYTADDGDFISGYNYFYLNYCPIYRQVNRIVDGKNKSEHIVTFPDFWDYDYYYFQCVEQCKEEGIYYALIAINKQTKEIVLPQSLDNALNNPDYCVFKCRKVKDEYKVEEVK